MLELAAIASASTRVVTTRLCSRSSAHFLECGLPTRGVPARLTTTSCWSDDLGAQRCGVGVPPHLAAVRCPAYEGGHGVALGLEPLAQPGAEEAG